MELLAGNARSALTHLLAASKAYPSNWKLQQMGESRQVIINNAMGCIYGSILRKPHLAYGFFRTAISACTPEGSAKESGLVSLPVPWRLALQYNVGLALLQARQTQPAFDCFLNVLQTFHSNPRIWLRLAEC
uniref:CCR4-NOT transcription complex subunit 10 n=1 Tax=Plectus sambesii TaxID=2011161 RepID=A0A914VPS7_9BILA